MGPSKLRSNTHYLKEKAKELGPSQMILKQAFKAYQEEFFR